MKLLLTSAGVQNPSIHRALEEMLAKPISDSIALAIPTSSYGHPAVSPEIALRFLTGEASTPMVELGWKSVGLLELTALPSISRDRWVPWIEEADILLVNGGDTLYLCHWLKESGVADLLTSYPKKVWMGLSAGSLVMTPHLGDEFVEWVPPEGGDATLGIVDFFIFPHLDHPDLPANTMADAERWAVGIGRPAYAIDDQTAIRVVDGNVDVISEGNWRLFAD